MTSSLGGAPLNNQNARQHGLYSRKAPLPPAEQIAALRAYTANLIAKSASIQSPRDIARALRRLTLAYNALNRLVRAQLFAPALAPAAVPGFGYPNPPAPRSSLITQHSSLRTFWTARFPFVHPIVFNLTQLLFNPIRLSAQSP